ADFLLWNWRHTGRSPRVCAVLRLRQAGRQSALVIQNMARRHELSRGLCWGIGRGSGFFPQTKLRLFPAHGLYRSIGADWLRGRAPWQLYQSRASGTSQRCTLGYGVPQYGAIATSSVVTV